MEPAQPFKIFISSTSVDLAQHRNAVAEQLRLMGQTVLMMEEFGSRPTDAVTVCEKEIKTCDVFVGLYGARYGHAPVKGGPSITEQEYNFARQLGKRCLCYFGETTAPAKSDQETTEKQARLRQFKARIDAALVRSTFTTPDDLRSQVAADIHRLLVGDPLAYSFHDVCQHWLTQEKKHLAALPIDSEHRLPTVASPLKEHWRNFLKNPRWHETLAVTLQEVRDIAQRFPELAGIALAARDVDLAASYSEILLDLRRIANPQALREVARVIERLDPESKANSSTKATLSAVHTLQQRLKDLRRQADQPAFQRCFLAMGGRGSGKTHFIASLLAEADDFPVDGKPVFGVSQFQNRNYFLLPLQPPTNGFHSLRDQIVQAISAMSGANWRGLEEFEQFLEKYSPARPETGKTKLVIVLDDAQKWLQIRPQFREELMDLINDLTRLHSIYWLITIQDTSWDDLAGAGSDKFWLKYSSADFTARRISEPEEHPVRALAIDAIWSKLLNSGGWLSLDDLNSTDKVGIQILRTLVKSEAEKDRWMLTYLESEDSPEQFYSNPLLAWILFELSEQTSEVSLKTLIVDPVYIDLIVRFWEKRRADLLRESRVLSETRLNEFIWFVANGLARSGDLTPLKTHLIDLVVAAAKGRSEFEERDQTKLGLEVLKRGSLLKEIEDQHPQYPSRREERIEIRFLPFWEWQLAQQLLEREPVRAEQAEATRREVVAWSQLVRSKSVERGTLEFLLLLLDRDVRNRRFVIDTWRGCLNTPELPRKAIWFAAPKSSKDIQNSLVVWSSRHPTNSIDPAELFGFMYFINEARPDVLNTLGRLRLLRPYYRSVHEVGLESYYLYIVERAFAQTNDNRITFICLPLFSSSVEDNYAGCEVMSITSVLANVALQTLLRNTGNDILALLTGVIGYLKDSTSCAAAEYQAHQQTGSWQRFFFREWFLHEFCTHLVRRRGFDTYQVLADQQWFRPETLDIAQPIGREMEREANIALGYHYRTCRKEMKSAFIELVKKLNASSDPKDRAEAFHLIRHTQPTGKEAETRVDVVFSPMLQQIFQDPALARTVDWFKTFFQINLPDWDRLARQRPQSADGRGSFGDRLPDDSTMRSGPR